MHQENYSDPFDIGGFSRPKSNKVLNTVLTFSDNHDRILKVETLQVCKAFLAMNDQGLIPELDENWCGILGNSDELGSSRSTSELGIYSGLLRVESGLCECCGSEVHAEFVYRHEQYMIERWCIVTTIMILIEKGFLTTLPNSWYLSLEHEYERICETGRKIVGPGQSGSWYV